MPPPPVDYWKGSVTPVLREALVEMTRARPDDPVAWLGNFLRNKATKKHSLASVSHDAVDIRCWPLSLLLECSYASRP